MRETVLALYDDLGTAQAAVRELVAAGYERGSIGLAVNDTEGRYSHHVHAGDEAAMVSRLEEEDVSGSEGAGFGAIIGGLTGIVAGLTAITIPGIGPIIADRGRRMLRPLPNYGSRRVSLTAASDTDVSRPSCGPRGHGAARAAPHAPRRERSSRAPMPRRRSRPCRRP